MNKMTLSEELMWRGQIKDKTFEDIRYLDKPKTFYLGADCQSSDSLTIGNLAVYMLARRLVEYGWNAVLLVGGATSRIGDPGGKDEERELKSIQEIEQNVAGIQAQVSSLFNGQKFKLVNNYDWFKDVGYLEFLREVGKHYSMTELLQRDFIANRIGEAGSGISYAEFSYSLIQGYDYWHLFKELGVELQIGGSDQWGNMLSGVPLVRKKENIEVHALSMPLVINKSTGKKFGKSEDGAVWLDETKTSVFDFYQFWLNVDDEGAPEYVKVYTTIEPDEYDALIDEFNQAPHKRALQKYLAEHVTDLIHGEEKMNQAKRISGVLFDDTDFSDITAKDIEEMKRQLPVTTARNLSEVLVESGLAGSKSEARRFIEQGAVSMNSQKISEDREVEITPNGAALIKRGKNKFALAT